MIILRKDKAEALNDLERRAIASIPDHDLSSSIPKLIHQCYPSIDLPPELQDNVAYLKMQNPDWHYRLYHDSAIEDFIYLNYGQSIFSVYKRINPEYGAARSDFFRYLLMFKIGGVYLDIKSRSVKKLDEVVSGGSSFITSQWGDSEAFKMSGRHRELFDVTGGEFQQWHIICAAGHPALRNIIIQAIHNICRYSVWRFGVGKHGVLRTTGPIMYTKAIKRHIDAGDIRLMRSHEEIGLQYSVVPDHTRLFGRHYSVLTSPVVIPSSWHEKLGSQLYRSLRKVRRGARELFRS